MARRATALAALAALVALSATPMGAAARRLDQDFEFADDAPARDHRYIYDPHNPLCRSLQCKKREVCVLRDESTALCASKKQLTRQGAVLGSAPVTGAEAEAEAKAGAGTDEDVFYEAGAGGREGRGCVGCGPRARARFLCGSDNRTYSSLCRLDLHNCVRRPRPPVALQCRGFCPCAPAPSATSVRRTESQHRKSDLENNEVLPELTASARAGGTGSCALEEMSDRLLDWFSVVMEEAGGRAPTTAGFPRGCKPEVRWMFAHLDADGDGALSGRELYALRHDERERCLRPWVAACGGARPLRRGPWCACLRRAARPCAALARAHRPRPGAYVPACDSNGFYRARQCHAALGVCWCVDAHGAERAGSRVRGAPRCRAPSPGPDDEDADADTDAELPASGDGELRY